MKTTGFMRFKTLGFKNFQKLQWEKTVFSRTEKGNAIVFEMKFPCKMEIQPCTN